MKRFYIFILGCLFSLSLFSANPKFSVLTCSPGDEAYSLYGHTGLRYCDEEAGIDVVFNYGYFDFDSPNFMEKPIIWWVLWIMMYSARDILIAVR